MKKYLDFSQEFGKIDEELIAEAGKPWTIKRDDIFRLYRRKIGQAAAILLAFITVAGNSHVQAAVKEFTTKIGELMGFSKDLSAYTEVINQVQTKSGISLTINEVILDNYSLIVSVKPDYEEKKKESLYLWINDEKTLINGKRYQSFSSTTGLMDLDSYTKYEMDTEMVLMQEYDGVELPAGETEIHLVLDVGSSAPISEKNRSENITEFVYDFTITAEQLKEQTIRKKMNMEISGGDGCNLILKELAMNDLHSRITALGVTPDDKWLNEYELKLKGTDSFGNPVSFEGAGFGPENELRFETSVFGDYEEGDIVDADNFQMSLPDKNCQYLDLQLYQRKIRWDLQSAEQLDDEYYGIDISYVDNIVRTQRITRIPKAQKYFKGVINLRGEIIPVMSLRLKFDLKPDEYTNATRIIIIKLEPQSAVGLIVDEVKEVLTLSENDIEKNTAIDMNDAKAQYLSGIGKNGDNLISLLNMSSVIVGTAEK